MGIRRDRRRFERAVERAMRPSRRASARSAFSRKARGYLRHGAILFSTVAVGAALVYASLWWVGSRKGDIAKAATPVSVTESTVDAGEERLREARQVHLRELLRVLRTDAEKLSEIARRSRGEGRVTDLGKDRAENAAELRSFFVSHRVLSGDLQNHYPEYSRAKERLRRTVAEQEEEFHQATSLVMTKLSLPPDAEHRRLEVARSLLEKCLEKGPGMTLTIRPDGYRYTARGRSRGYDGTTIVADDERAAFDAFTSFLPDAEVTAHCESLKKRSAGISANARRLSAEALALAERPTLSGECTFTRPE